jgi:hypothetical protein
MTHFYCCRIRWHSVVYFIGLCVGYVEMIWNFCVGISGSTVNALGWGSNWQSHNDYCESRSLCICSDGLSYEPLKSIRVELSVAVIPDGVRHDT